MNVKSRYEVVSELEDKKRSLIREKDGFSQVLNTKKKELKDIKRELEDKEEEIKEFEDSMEDAKGTLNTLIESIDESLKRFSDLNKK